MPKIFTIKNVVTPWLWSRVDILKSKHGRAKPYLKREEEVHVGLGHEVKTISYKNR